MTIIPACIGLNKYLWSVLEGDGTLNKANYGGLTPIVPIGETPNLLQAIDQSAGVSTFPYIVYRWYTNGYDANNFYKPTDTVTYEIYALDNTLLNTIVSRVVQLFKQFDDSAQAVNAYIRSLPNPGPLADYSYNYISVAAATGGVPQVIENDPYKATVTVRVNYLYYGDEKLP
jgi:hypothetical protein